MGAWQASMSDGYPGGCWCAECYPPAVTCEVCGEAVPPDEVTEHATDGTYACHACIAWHCNNYEGGRW